jgi:biotin carboxylase
MLLLPTTTYRARDFVEAAEKLGVVAVVGSNRKQALQDLQPERTLALDLADPAKAAAGIERFALERPLSAIVPTDDSTAVAAAIASERLGLPHNPPAAATVASRKDLLRACLREAGVRTPRHRLVALEADPESAARDTAYPCVLKPIFLSGSRGVIRADGPDSFARAFRRIRDLLLRPEVRERDPAAADHILVEEFAPGFEVALEAILLRGQLKILAIFDKPDPLDGPFFEETIYVTPSRLPDETQSAVAGAVTAAARAIGLREGPVHAELRVDQCGPWVIELAARSIGGLCSRCLHFGTGLTLEEIIISQALGWDVSTCERARGASGVMMIPIPRAGTLLEVDGLRAASAVSGIIDVTISATLGQPVTPLPEGSSYLGFIFARGDGPEGVEAALREAHRNLRFRIDPLEERLTAGGPAARRSSI